jgi:hypothetical protein
MSRRQSALFAVTFIASISFFSHAVKPHAAICLWIFVAALLAGIGLVVNIWWMRFDQRRLDYQTLEEALRVYCFWALAGLKDSAAENYLGSFRSEIVWTRQAVRNVCPPSRQWRTEFDALPAEEQYRRIGIVRKNWVAEQATAFKDQAEEYHRWASILRLTGSGFVKVGCLCAVALLFFAQSAELAGSESIHFLLLASGLLILTGGFLLLIGERRSYAELSRRCDRLQKLFNDGRLELEQNTAGGDLPRIRETLRALGREAIAEYSQRLYLRRAGPRSN